MFKYLVNALIIVLAIIFVFSGNMVYGAPSITSVSCSTTPNKTTYDNINKTEFRYNCSISIDRDGQRRLQVGIYATSSTTQKVSGNGTQVITITSPQDRFFVKGPKQAGIPEAITTSSTIPGITIFRDKINTDARANFNFKLYYYVFDADKADNTYRQHYRIALFDKNNVLQDEDPTSPSTYYVEFTVPERVSIDVNPPPVCSYDTMQEVFDKTHYEESDQDIIATIKSNNTWVLKAKIDSKPSDGTNTIGAKKIYFECNSGTGYTCWSGADVKVQFPGAGGAAKYVEVAKDPDQTEGDYTTGSSDNMNLNSIDVSITYFLKNKKPAYQPGTYTTTTTFKITAPR